MNVFTLHRHTLTLNCNPWPQTPYSLWDSHIPSQSSNRRHRWSLSWTLVHLLMFHSWSYSETMWRGCGIVMEPVVSGGNTVETQLTCETVFDKKHSSWWFRETGSSTLASLEIQPTCLLICFHSLLQSEPACKRFTPFFWFSFCLFLFASFLLFLLTRQGIAV